jgi:thiol-disulfide isomerase/thioredoxin
MKTLTLITAFIFLIGFGVKAQKDSVEKMKSAADIFWETKPKSPEISTYRLPENYTPQEFLIYKESKIKANINNEMYSRLLREWGIEFWKRFPNDPRRFAWLGSTLIFQPAFFSDVREGALAEFEGRFVAPLDTVAKTEWKNLFDQYRKEAIENGQDIGPLGLLLRDDKKWRSSVTGKFDFEGHLNQVINYVKRFPEELTREYKKGYAAINDLLLINERKDFGLDEQDIRNYIGLLNATEFFEFHKVAEKMELLLKLEQDPLQLKAKTIGGEEIDLKQFKGKLILVDFWHPYCSSCIGLMPEMKSVYEKYKSKGFEVLSVCKRYDYYIKTGAEALELTAIKRVYEKINASWPSVLLEPQQGKLLFAKYGWSGVPQVLLLNEEGRLIQFNSELIIPGGLERLVKLHFDRKSKENQSGR